MHERSLVRALLRQVQQVADENPCGRVREIHVQVGEFSGVEPELLTSAYEDLIQDSPFNNATLDVEKVVLEGICEDCGRRFRIKKFCFQCAGCGSERLTLSGGEELLLESIVIEEAEP